MTLTYKGNTIVSHHSLVEAKKIVGGLKRTDFTESLLKVESPSPGQLFWIHKLAIEAGQPKVVGPYMKLIELFKTAKGKLKRPAITFQLGNDSIKIAYASDTSKNPNHLYVYNNDEYVGKITPLGVFHSYYCPAYVLVHLDELNENPVGKAKDYGHRSGNCCFCARELTDKRSLDAGYGEICSTHYGLPWGE